MVRSTPRRQRANAHDRRPESLAPRAPDPRGRGRTVVKPPARTAANMLPSLEDTPWAHLQVDLELVDIATALSSAADRWPERVAWTFIDAGGEVRYGELRDQ